uniref:Uncharacterized protein n=1 Tax=Siphoviridae sp. ctomJ2 TaxID=2827593 RepID=A0A8S5LK76_9CAUD|nr:MAG TPA: hypothetical protein [Siphoviridae sp. ctomJ2]
MAKGKPIKVICFMHFTDTDRTVPIEQLTPEEMEYCSKKMTERLSRTMSNYYANDREAFELL